MSDNSPATESGLNGLCPTLERLLRSYNSSLAEHSRALAELTSRMGTVTKKEYERLARVSEDRRLEAEEARLAAESHKTEHGC